MLNKKLFRLLCSDNGFTLIEVIVGILMFSIVFLAILRMFMFSTVQNRRTNELEELYSIAQRSMEYVKNNIVVAESESYQQLFGYTDDEETLNRFTVIYKAEKVAVGKPYGESEVTSPVKATNYDINIEVFYTKDRDKLGELDASSKVSIAQQNKIPIINLNSQLTQYKE